MPPRVFSRLRRATHKLRGPRSRRTSRSFTSHPIAERRCRPVAHGTPLALRAAVWPARRPIIGHPMS